MAKNLCDMDKLAGILLFQKKQTLRLPIDKLIFLISILRQIELLKPDRISTLGDPPKIQQETISMLTKWIDRGLDSDHHSILT